MTDITLGTGQLVRVEDGIMQVQPRAVPPHTYKLTARHAQGGLLDARTASYDAAVAFLKQLEPLGYTLRNIVRLEG